MPMSASSGERPSRLENRLPMGRARRIADQVIGGLTRRGVVPNTYRLSVNGRKTGRLHSTPEILAERGADKWMVAPYGPCHGC